MSTPAEREKKNMKIIWLHSFHTENSNLYLPSYSKIFTFKMLDRVYDSLPFRICHAKDVGGRKKNVAFFRWKKVWRQTWKKNLSEKLSTKDENKRLKPTKSYTRMWAALRLYVTKLYFLCLLKISCVVIILLRFFD